MSINSSPLFSRMSIKNGFDLRNRAVMAPMTTWSANEDGSISEQEISYYERRSQGVGMVITGCTHVTENGIGFHNEFAAYDDKFIPSLKKLADAIHRGGAKAVLQVFHAGNKAVPELINNADVVSASALTAPSGPFNSGEVVSRALSDTEIQEMIHAFGETVRRAIEAGFDGVELHGAHGFLLQNFLSPLFNQREDSWGGSVEKRKAFAVEVVSKALEVIQQHSKKPFILGYRFSPDEPQQGALRIEHTLDLVDTLIDLGVDYVHASLKDANNTPLEEHEGKNALPTIAAHISGRVPLIVAGQMNTADDANKALENGATLAAIGRALVINPEWLQLSYTNQQQHIQSAINTSDAVTKSIPTQLMEVIASTKGWFSVRAA